MSICHEISIFVSSGFLGGGSATSSGRKRRNQASGGGGFMFVSLSIILFGVLVWRWIKLWYNQIYKYKVAQTVMRCEVLWCDLKRSPIQEGSVRAPVQPLRHPHLLLHPARRQRHRRDDGEGPLVRQTRSTRGSREEGAGGVSRRVQTTRTWWDKYHRETCRVGASSQGCRGEIEKNSNLIGSSFIGNFYHLCDLCHQQTLRMTRNAHSTMPKLLDFIW